MGAENFDRAIDREALGDPTEVNADRRMMEADTLTGKKLDEFTG
jgi:hypothetical protein